LFGPINLGIELFLKDREKFLKYEIELIANLEDLKKNNSGGKLNLTCQQICEKMLADINLLKNTSKDKKIVSEIDKICKIISKSGFIERIALADSLEEQKKEIKEYEACFAPIKKIFGQGSFVELLAFLTFHEIKKDGFLVSPDLISSNQTLLNAIDYYSNHGWKNNLYLEVKIMRLICIPCNNSEWEQGYLQNIEKLESILILLLDKNSQENIEIIYYKMFYLFRNKNLEKVCELFEKIPKPWHIGSYSGNNFYIISIYLLASEAYYRCPGRGLQALETAECALHFAKSRVPTKTTYGAKLFYRIGSNLHDKYMFYKNDNGIKLLNAIFAEEGFVPPWQKKIKLDQG